MPSVIIPSQWSGDIKIVPFDFSSLLALGETLSYAYAVSTLFSGTDLAAANVTGASVIAGTVVEQTLQTPVAGMTYTIAVTVTTSLGQTLTLQGFLVGLGSPT